MVDALASQLLAHFGAPNLIAARKAAKEEVDFAASLCDHAQDTLIAVHRNYKDGEMREASSGKLEGILAVSEEQLVSMDFLHDPHSAIFDAPSTMLIGDHTVKVLAWYDNEWGYSCRVVDLVNLIISRL